MSGDATVIGSGETNVVNGTSSSIVGGYVNNVLREYSTVVGGTENYASEMYTTVGQSLLCVGNTCSSRYVAVAACPYHGFFLCARGWT
mgnify:CR=1 FL=1